MRDTFTSRASRSPSPRKLNPIERFWRWLKSKIDGCKSYQRRDEVVANIRKLIWHDHEGRLVTTIRFNINAYAALL
jgi:hypothetical protein